MGHPIKLPTIIQNNLSEITTGASALTRSLSYGNWGHYAIFSSLGGSIVVS